MVLITCALLHQRDVQTQRLILWADGQRDWPVSLSGPFPVSGGDKDKQVTSLPAEDNHTGMGQEPPEVLSSS